MKEPLAATMLLQCQLQLQHHLATTAFGTTFTHNCMPARPHLHYLQLNNRLCMSRQPLSCMMIYRQAYKLWLVYATTLRVVTCLQPG